MILQAKKQMAKRKKCVTDFNAWVCKTAGLWIRNKTEDGVRCDTTLCDACMTMWRKTGYRSNQQLSAREKAIMEEAEAKKKKNKRVKRDRYAKEQSDNHVGAKVRSSRHVLEQDSTTKTSNSKHKKDKNGCCHGCLDCYQSYSSPTYWQRPGACLLSQICIDCNAPIWRGLG